MRLDRPVLVSNLAAGALWLLVPLVWLGAWVLALIGLGYVVVAGLFLSAAYGTPIPSRRREALVWAGPWALAVTVWFAVLSPIDGPGVFSLVTALLVGTTAYAVWQLTAGLLRELVRWGSSRGGAVGGP